MEQVLSEIVRPVVNILFGHIMKQLRYVTSSGKYVTDMRNKMEVLNGKKYVVTEHSRRNEMYDKEISPRVPGWLVDVENVKKDVESIPSNAIGCFHMKMRYRVGRKASKATEKIDKLIEEEITWSDAPLPTGRLTSSSSTSSSGVIFKSRDMPFNDALEFLQKDETKSQVIALCGMGGVGKTTMMKQLKTAANEKKMFGLFVEVVIGRTPNMLSIQNQIAESIGGEGLHVTGETIRGESLCKMFTKALKTDKTKILVILDDVWETINLEHIGLTSPLPNGVKVLLTSRDANVCGKIAADAHSGLHLVRVDALEKAEANKFFSLFTEVSEEDDQDKYLIGCEIVKKCGCLPLAIRLIGSTLKFQEVHVWRDQLSRLKHNDLDKNVQEIIMISYEKLEDKDKEILLLCGLFPEDFDIPIEYFVRYAWGLNLLQHVSTLTNARDKTRASVSKLINSSLLMKSDYLGCVKMHDLVLAFVLNRVSGSDLAWIVNHSDVSKWDRDEMSKNCKIMSLTCMGMSRFPRNFSYLDLSLLQLMHGDQLLKFPEDFYDNMQNLKVIAYYKMEYPFLPRSLTCSTNLRMLCLRGCKLKSELSFLGDLVNLEELSFAGCGIHRLPSTIGNLRKLKLLDLSECANIFINYGVLQNLENLEELYLTGSGWGGILLGDDNFEKFKRLVMQLHALEVELRGNTTWLKNMSFKKLEKFKISIGCLLEEKENEMHSLRNILKLVTDNYKDFLDCKIDMLIKKTEKLHLDVKDLIHLKDIVSVHPYDQFLFRHLRDLKVSKCAKLKYLFTIHVAIGLRKLERLTISSCSILEAVVYNDGSEINSVGEMIKFEEIKFLSLEVLPELVCLFPSDCVVELPNLVELEVKGLTNFTSIYHVPDSNNISTLQLPLLSNKVGIPNLQKLRIKSMEKLKHIWACGSGEVVCCTSTLREIEVVGCRSLENLFPTNLLLLLKALTHIRITDSGKEEIITTVAFSSNVIHSFQYLEDLVLRNYNGVEVVFEIESPSSNRELVTTINNQVLPNLQHLGLHDMKSMSHVWKCNNWNNFLSLQKQESFLNLTSIELRGCYRIRYLFSPLMAKLFSNLKEIYIQDCDDMEEVVSKRDDKDDGEEITAYTTTTLFPCLHKLNLWRVGNLKCIGGSGDDKVSHNGILSWSLCQFPKEIKIAVANKLSSAIPSYAIRHMQKLETLIVIGCELLTEVFETTQGINNNNNGGGGGGTSLADPRLDITSAPQLSNLMKLEISSCNLLQHVFTFSTLESLGQLQELMIKHCKTMKVIVKNENAYQRKVVKFPRLKALELCSLPNLEGFFLGLNEFEWPSLEKVTIKRCPQISVFTGGESRTKELKYIHTSLGKHTLDHGLNFDLTRDLPHQKMLPSSENTSLYLEQLSWCSFHNVIEIIMKYESDAKIRNVIPSSELLQVKKLERIQVRYCNIEEVFEVGSMEGSNKESQTVVAIPNLEQVELEHLEHLKYIWKSNHHVVLEFPNLTTLSIFCCDRLKHVFASNMVGSLARLQELHIRSCRDMETIIAKQEEEFEYDVNAQQQTVLLPCLKVLKLERLESLKGFCLGKVDFSWPSLDTLEIKDCPRITLFTDGHLDTPALDIIHTSRGRYYVGEDGINSFIKTKQQEGFRLLKMKRTNVRGGSN